jgi:hypothetical protein
MQTAGQEVGSSSEGDQMVKEQWCNKSIRSLTAWKPDPMRHLGTLATWFGRLLGATPLKPVRKRPTAGEG